MPWFGFFILVCLAVMIDDARHDVEFMNKFKKKLKDLEED